MMRPSTSSCIALVAALAAAGTAEAQWVSFTNETQTRLRLKPFVDNPDGNPLRDGEEKDIAVADLDKDGDEDAIVVRKEPFSNPGARQDVLLMNEGGRLIDRTATLAPEFLTDLTDSRDVFIGNFTSDTWPDVVIANTFGEQPKFYRNRGEDGGGSWLGLVDESSTRLPFLDLEPFPLQFCAVWGGDVTGDGALDIFFSNYAELGGTVDVLLINDGTGVFTDQSEARLGDRRNVAFGTGAEIHDVDNDGDNDIIKISTLYSQPPFGIGQFILFNDGGGVFTGPFDEVPTNSPYMFAAGHLNGDNLIDFVNEGDNQDRAAITTSIEPDTNLDFHVLVFNPSPRTSGFGGNTKLADIDGDGDLDAGIAPVDVDIQNCPNPGDFALLRNDGSGQMSDPWPSNQDQNLHQPAHDFGFIDINTDGCLDIIMGKCMGWNVFIQQNCGASGERGRSSR